MVDLLELAEENNELQGQELLLLEHTVVQPDFNVFLRREGPTEAQVPG